MNGTNFIRLTICEANKAYDQSLTYTHGPRQKFIHINPNVGNIHAYTETHGLHTCISFIAVSSLQLTHAM